MVRVSGVFAHAKETVQARAGEVLFRVGDAGTHMYGVISGEVVLSLDGQELARVGPDDVFGELALIDQEPRSLDAVASQDSELAVIDRRLFQFLVTETPTFALQVMTTMAERLRARV